MIADLGSTFFLYFLKCEFIKLKKTLSIEKEYSFKRSAQKRGIPMKEVIYECWYQKEIQLKLK